MESGPESLSRRLTSFLREERRQDVFVRDLAPMEDGHAGLTFGFRLEAGNLEIGRYVLRMAPAGVTRRGNTDVYRQAPLLRAALVIPAPASAGFR